MVGIVMTSVEEMGVGGMRCSWLGLGLTVLGVVLSAAKGIVTNVLMVGPLRLHPLEVIWRMALPSCLQCLVYSVLLGELPQLYGWWLEQEEKSTLLAILFNGWLAFFLNWVSFTANKKTSALSMTVAGNVKQTLSILLAIWIFNTPVSSLSAAGILVTIVGAAWYSWLSLQAKAQSNDHQPLPK